MAFLSRSIVASLVLRTRGYTNGSQVVQQENAKIRRSMRGVQAQGVALAATFGVIGAAAVKSSKSILTASAAAEETANLFRVTMGDLADEGEAFSEAFSKSVGGLSETRIKQSLGTFQNMIETMGLAKETAFGMSKAMTQLSFDISSFFDLSLEEGFRKIQSGLSGEIEPLRRIGIVVNEMTVKRKAFQEGLIRTINQEMTEAEKVYARFLVILDGAKNAQGDLARTQFDLTNATRLLMDNIRKLSEDLGDLINEDAKNLVNTIKGVVAAISDWSSENQALAREILLITAVAGPLLIVTSTLLLAIPPLVSGITMIGTALGAVGAAIGPLLPVIAVLGAVVLAIEAIRKSVLDGNPMVEDFVWAWEKVKSVVSDVTLFLGQIRLAVIKLVKEIGSTLLQVLDKATYTIEKIMAAVAAFTESMIESPLRIGKAWEAARDAFVARGEELARFAKDNGGMFNVWTRDAEKALFEFTGWLEQPFTDRFKGVFEDLKSFLGPLGESLGDFFADGFEQLKKDLSGITGFLGGKLDELASGRLSQLKDLIDGIVDSVKEGGKAANEFKLSPTTIPTFQAVLDRTTEIEKSLARMRSLGVKSIVDIEKSMVEVDLAMKTAEGSAREFADIGDDLKASFIGIGESSSIREFITKSVDGFQQIKNSAREAIAIISKPLPADPAAQFELKLLNAELENTRRGFDQLGIESEQTLLLMQERLLQLREQAVAGGLSFELQQIDQQLDEIGNKLTDPLERNQLTEAFAGMIGGMQQLRTEWGNMRNQMSNAVVTIGNTISSSLTSNIMAALQGTKSLGEAFQATAAAIITKIIEIGIQMMIQLAISRLINILTAKMSAATAAKVAAAWGPAATLAAIATGGVAVATGLGALTGGLAAGTAISSAAGASAAEGVGGDVKSFLSVSSGGGSKIPDFTPKFAGGDEGGPGKGVSVTIVNTLNAADVVRAGLGDQENQKLIPNIIDSRTTKSARARSRRI